MWVHICPSNPGSSRKDGLWRRLWRVGHPSWVLIEIHSSLILDTKHCFKNMTSLTEYLIPWRFHLQLCSVWKQTKKKPDEKNILEFCDVGSQCDDTLAQYPFKYQFGEIFKCFWLFAIQYESQNPWSSMWVFNFCLWAQKHLFPSCSARPNLWPFFFFCINRFILLGLILVFCYRLPKKQVENQKPFCLFFFPPKVLAKWKEMCSLNYCCYF